MTQPAHMRNMPKQERGERRMQGLLDAAEQTFAERGYQATTTNEIAARAQTSIGTLYRFFPNKEAIIEHLNERYTQEVYAMHEKMFLPEMATIPLAEMIDRLVDPIVDLKSAHPGLVALFIGPHAALQIPAEFQKIVDKALQHLEQLWMRRFPHLDAETCYLYAVIFYQIRQKLLSLAFSSIHPGQERIIGELKTNLFRYLEPIDSREV